MPGRRQPVSTLHWARLMPRSTNLNLLITMACTAVARAMLAESWALPVSPPALKPPPRSRLAELPCGVSAKVSMPEAALPPELKCRLTKMLFGVALATATRPLRVMKVSVLRVSTTLKPRFISSARSTWTIRRAKSFS